jgi:peptide/nickel transport system substrate-binding protein
MSPGRHLLSLALVWLAVACVASSTPAPTPSASVVTGGVLNVGQSSDITSLDPWTASDPATLAVVRQIYEPLVELEPGGFRIIPKLAERWLASADGRVWTFQLRQGVHFHDGTALDAAAVAFNFERARGFARFDLGSLITTIETPDTSTIVFTLRTPFAPFLASLATASFGIVSPTCLRQGPVWATPATRCAAGTGPFRFESWVAGDRITLARNSSYWGRDAAGRALPYLDAVTFRALRDDATRVGELRTGGIQVALDIGPSSTAAVRADPNLAIRRRPSYDVSFLGFGTAKPFDTVEVRRAVALAVDRAAIVQTAYAGDARPATQLLPPGLLGYDDTVTEFAKYDTAAAKKALADAGYPNGFATELYFSPAPTSALPDPRRIADAIAADLGKIGINVDVRMETDVALDARGRAGQMPLWLDDRIAERSDADEFLLDISANPVVQELVRRARAENDVSKRSELYKQVTKLAQQDVTRVPLFHSAPPLALVLKVNGLVPQPITRESFATVSLGR